MAPAAVEAMLTDQASKPGKVEWQWRVAEEEYARLRTHLFTQNTVVLVCLELDKRGRTAPRENAPHGKARI